MDNDYREMLSAFSNEGVEYLVVGAFALAAHGQIRATNDIDLWIRPTPENARNTWVALARFGAPVEGLTIEDLCDEDTIFQVGVAPHRVDVITSISGVTFDEAWNNRVKGLVEGVNCFVLGPKQLMQNKSAAGRAKDKLDLRWLKRHFRDDGSPR